MYPDEGRTNTDYSCRGRARRMSNAASVMSQSDTGERRQRIEAWPPTELSRIGMSLGNAAWVPLPSSSRDGIRTSGTRGTDSTSDRSQHRRRLALNLFELSLGQFSRL